jgi:hypothetical protein
MTINLILLLSIGFVEEKKIIIVNDVGTISLFVDTMLNYFAFETSTLIIIITRCIFKKEIKSC